MDTNDTNNTIPQEWVERVRSLERAFNNIWHMDEAAGGNVTAQEALNLAQREAHFGRNAAAELRKMIALARTARVEGAND